jgi:S-adenosylmethionine-diacylglycerol 3-amino-3-carboxypropyl transferase
MDTATTRSGILQRLFAVWFDAFVYNQIWEDPRVDIDALRIDENSRILCISSGGCNALNYTLAGPAAVTAVDVNRHHIGLLKLKIAAARHLPTHELFFRFFGLGKHDDNIAAYYEYIAPNLDEETRDLWEENGIIGGLFVGDRINYFKQGGLYEHSRNGYFLRFFHRLSHFLGCRPESILEARSSEEQEELFEKHIAPFFDSRLIKFLGKLPVTMFGLGIPPQQYDELKKELSNGRSVIDIYRERAKRLACGFPIEDNYFAWQALARRYDTENRRCLPEYLKEKNFETLKANAAKIRTAVCSVTEAIRDTPAETFNRFVFLDAQDWMDGRTLTELWAAIAEFGERGSRIIFRTAGSGSPIEQRLPVDLRSRFEYHREESLRHAAADRASIYGGFHLYTLK